MEIRVSKMHREAYMKFDPQEWIKIELYAEKCGLRLFDVVEMIATSGWKNFRKVVNGG